MYIGTHLHNDEPCVYLYFESENIFYRSIKNFEHFN